MIFESCRINVFVFNISSSCSGHKWKQGMWSKEEIDILISNIDRYVKVLSVFVAPADVVSACFTRFVWLDVFQGRGIDDPAEIIFEMSKEERKDFYRSVALGLNRPLFAVYRRVLRMYDNRNHVGKWVNEEKMTENTSRLCFLSLSSNVLFSSPSGILLKR